jgi:hypothetical protein
MRSLRAHDVHGKTSTFLRQGFLDLSAILPYITAVALDQKPMKALLVDRVQSRPALPALWRYRPRKKFSADAERRFTRIKSGAGSETRR